jgi:hypothetical protein
MWTCPECGASLDAAPAPPAGVSIVFVLLTLGIAAATIILGIRLLRALGDGALTQALVALLMVVPCVSLATLLIVNTSATRRLKTAGLQVGLMGVSQDQLDSLAAQDGDHS